MRTTSRKRHPGFGEDRRDVVEAEFGLPGAVGRDRVVRGDADLPGAEHQPLARGHFDAVAVVRERRVDAGAVRGV